MPGSLDNENVAVIGAGGIGHWSSSFLFHVQGNVSPVFTDLLYLKVWLVRSGWPVLCMVFGGKRS